MWFFKALSVNLYVYLEMFLLLRVYYYKMNWTRRILLFRKLFSFSNGFACHFVIYETFLRLSKTASEREWSFRFPTRTKIAFLKFQGVVVNMRTRQHCQEKWSWKLHPWDVKKIKWKATGKMVQMFYYENHGKCCKTLWKHDGKKLKVSHKL